MDTTEVLQLCVIETLNADGQAIDAGAPIIGKLVAFGSAGVGLQSDLYVGGETHMLQQAIQESFIGACGKQARRATAEEDRADLATLPLFMNPGQIIHEIPQQCIDVFRLGKLAVLLMRIEIAVRTFTHTPGDVDVQTQGRDLQPLGVAHRCARLRMAFQLASNWRSAWPRWLMLFFIAGSSSADAQPCVGT